MDYESSITAIVLTTGKRYTYIDECISSLNSNDWFDEKILSIDEFDGYFFPQELIDKYESQGWIISRDDHKSRLKSLIKATNLVTSKYIFYQEDDITVNLPDKKNIIKLLEMKAFNRRCGYVALNLGGAAIELKDRIFGDLLNCNNNRIYSDDQHMAFIREEEHRNDYFFEFPSLFISQKLFIKCLNTINYHLNESPKPFQIERALTSFWFASKLNQYFFKCCYCKNNLLEVLNEEPTKMMERCALIKTLDPNQGSNFVA